MSRSFYIALLLSAVVHGGMLVWYPTPDEDSSGQDGERQEITVLGVVRLDVPAPVDEVIPEPEPLPVEPAELELPSLPEATPLIILTRPTEEPVPDFPVEASPDQIPDLPVEPPPDVPPEAASDGQPGTPGTTELSQGQIQDIRSQYLTRIAAEIEESKRYPAVTRRRGIEGTATVEFTIASDGSISDLRLEGSSKSYSLDSEAQDIVSEASPFEPIPAELATKEIRIVVPISFRIED